MARADGYNNEQFPHREKPTERDLVCLTCHLPDCSNRKHPACKLANTPRNRRDNRGRKPK